MPLKYIKIFFHYYYLTFFNKHTIFHYNKLKLQQNDINTKRYTRLKFKHKQKQNKTKKTQKKHTQNKKQNKR